MPQTIYIYILYKFVFGSAMEDADAHFCIPANVPTYFFEELQELLPSAVAYEHDGDWW